MKSELLMVNKRKTALQERFFAHFLFKCYQTAQFNQNSWPAALVTLIANPTQAFQSFESHFK